MDIEQKDYEALVAKAGKVDDLEKRLSTAEEISGKVPDLEKKVDELEVGKKKAEDDLAAANTKITGFEEQSRAATLSGERMGGLGTGFVAKLPDTVKTRLGEQAKTLSDEDWSARLEELSALVGVKSDDKGEGGSGAGGSGGSGGSGGELSREELSRSGAGAGGGNGGNGGEASRAATSTVVGGLLRKIGPQPPKREPANKS